MVLQIQSLIRCSTPPPELFTACTISSPRRRCRCLRLGLFAVADVLKLCCLLSYLSLFRQFTALPHGRELFWFLLLVMLTGQLANMIILVGQSFTPNAAIVYLHVCFATPPIPLQVLVACRLVLLSLIRIIPLSLAMTRNPIGFVIKV